jgi:hypothetical protein
MLTVNLTPEMLEKLIDAYLLIGINAPKRPEREYAFQRMTDLISQRSPETIARMEREQKLA